MRFLFLFIALCLGALSGYSQMGEYIGSYEKQILDNILITRTVIKYEVKPPHNIWGDHELLVLVEEDKLPGKANMFKIRENGYCYEILTLMEPENYGVVIDYFDKHPDLYIRVNNKRYLFTLQGRATYYVYLEMADDQLFIHYTALPRLD